MVYRTCMYGEIDRWCLFLPELQFGALQRDVVEVLDATLDGEAIAHLNHCASLFRLQEFNLREKSEPI